MSENTGIGKCVWGNPSGGIGRSKSHIRGMPVCGSAWIDRIKVVPLEGA